MRNRKISRMSIIKVTSLCMIAGVTIVALVASGGCGAPVNIEIETLEDAEVSGEQSIEIARDMALNEGIDKESLVGKRIWNPDKIAVSVVYELPLLGPPYEPPDVLEEAIYQVRFQRQGHFVEIFVGADSGSFYGMRRCR